MKIVLLLVLFCLAWETYSSPIQIVENHELTDKVMKEKIAVAEGRQATGSVPAAAAAAAEDDDDDDDDEDDIEDVLGDDDDDDDDEDEVPAPAGQAAGGVQPVAAAAPAASDDDDDDEEDDYLERIFDDILDEDDDDDDDDVSPSTGVVQSVQQPIQQAAAQTVSEVAAPVGINEAESPAGLSADYPEQTVFYDEDNTGIDTKVDVQALNSKPSIDHGGQTVGQKLPATQQATNIINNNVSDDDDDEDDEEDGIEDALDDDDDDDDDDEGDDLIGDDVIEAKRSRSLENENYIPEVLTQRYNRFVDGIFTRINKILKQSYDPVRVRLSSGSSKQTKSKLGKTKSNSNSNNSNSTTTSTTTTSTTIKRKKSKNSNSKRKPKMDVLYQVVPTFEALSEATNPPSSGPVGISNKFMRNSEQKEQESATLAPAADEIVAEQRTTRKPKPKDRKPASSTNSKTSSSASSAEATSGSSKKNSAQKNTVNNSSNDKIRKAQGTLYGLASLKRMGNVKVIPEGNNSTIKSKFTLGPLTLRVEKSFKRGTVTNMKSATARTNEMIGRINLRVVNGAATLVSIKVQQPKQVQVESSDNHDRTREFVWKRTPHIAHLVSDKLQAATKSLLEPVPSQSQMMMLENKAAK